MSNSYDPESWEREYWIFEEERWDDLVELRKEEAKGTEYGDGMFEEVADALVLAKRYDEALEILNTIHKLKPLETSVHNLILTILKETSKKESDFNWIQTPEILRLDENLFQFCLSILKKKRKTNRSLTVIREALTIKNIFMDFTFKELEEWMRKDDRLMFIDSKQNMFSQIEILKK